MNRITRTAVHVVTADWAPHIEAAARAFAAAATAVYVAGYMVGTCIHRLNDALCALLVRKPQQPPSIGAEPPSIGAEPPSIERPIVQRFAVAAVPARCGIMPPTPMARAIAHVRGGMSQRHAATLCGVSRSSLQRAIKAV